MFNIQNLTLIYGDQVVFNDASCNIQGHEKLGIVGRNGSGKSTLLKILAGETEPDEGSINVDKKKTVAYVPQETMLSSSRSVFEEAFDAFSEYVALRNRERELESYLHDETAHTETIEAYAQVQEALNYYDYGSLERQTQYVLQGLGFSEAGYLQAVNTLSVGWQMRVLLARQLLCQADFYLFDEPTNHLDLPTKEWFLRFLRNMNAGYALITHARHFLDHACDKILEIERGDITIYTGTFTTYLKKREEQRQQKEHTRKHQEKEIARKRETIARFKAKPNKAKMAKAMERELEKMEVVEPEPPLPTVSFKFPETVRPGKIVLTVRNMSHAFGDNHLFNNVSFELRRGQKAALIAPNGVGKTTLFNLITGKLQIQQGEVAFGHNVKSAYFEQDQVRSLNHKNTIWQEIRETTNAVTEATMRTFLGAFLFSGDTIYRPISALSGGEKNRVAMVKTLLQKANLLFLDEPTNHLDIYAKDVLLQAIQQYMGTVLYISHDREFIEKTADTILELTPRGVVEYHDGYAGYLQQRHRSEQHNSQNSAVHGNASTRQSPYHSEGKKRKLYKQLQTLERYISQLEQERDTLAQQLHTTSYGTPSYDETLQKITDVQEKLDQYEKQWESTYNQIS